jgi:serine/threonine protein kinase
MGRNTASPGSEAPSEPERHTAPLPTGVMRPPPAAKVADDPKLLIGQELGRYKLLEVIGRGGMGSVYLAEHVKLGRRVAIKLLRPEYAIKRDAVARFFQEAKSVNKIRHRNIVDVTDFVELPDGRAFIVMELLEGQSLGRMNRQHGPLPVVDLLAILVQVCAALEAAHAVGIVHRDLKPDNIFVCGEGEAPLAKLLDFGIAKLVAEDYSDEVTWRTSVNSFLGTPAFMSPEQSVGADLDGRSDVYSLGAIMYELFCGQPLFTAKSFAEWVIQHCKHAPTPMDQTKRGALLPPALKRVVMRCLAKKRAERFASVHELRDALMGVLAELDERRAQLRPPTPVPPALVEPVAVPDTLDPLVGEAIPVLTRSRRGVGVAALLVIAVVGFVGFQWQHEPEPAPPVAVTTVAAPLPAAAPLVEQLPAVAKLPPRKLAPAPKPAPTRLVKVKRGKKPAKVTRVAKPRPAPMVLRAQPTPAPAPEAEPEAPSRDIGREETMNPFGRPAR